MEPRGDRRHEGGVHHDADERVVQVSGDGSEGQVLPNLSRGTASSGPAGADQVNRLPPVQEGQGVLLDATIRLSFHVKRRSLCDACGRSAVRDRGYGSEESSCNQGSIWFHVKQRRDTE